MTETLRAPPGPRGHLLFGSLPELKEDWIGYLRECERRYGSIVRLRMPWPINELIFVSDRALAERMFVDDADSFQNSRFTRRMAAPVLGNGLLLAEGEAWRRQRRLVQPAFHRTRVAGYVEEMRACTQAMVDAWPASGERDVYEDTLALSVRVAASTMLDLGRKV